MSLWRSPEAGDRAGARLVRGRRLRLALCADLVIASEDARIGTPYARMWGCYLSGMWIYRLGLTKAKEYALTGKPLSGSEAAEIGLINQAVPFARARGDGAPTTAKKLAHHSALAALRA